MRPPTADELTRLEELEDRVLGLPENPKLRDNHRFHGLYNREVGIFRRMRRREWIETFVTIKDKRGRVHPMKLNPAQRRLEAWVLRFERRGLPVRVIVLKARQQGFSTLILAMFVWYVMTRQFARGMLIAHKDDASQAIFDRAKIMFENMPKEQGSTWNFLFERASARSVLLGVPIGSKLYIQSAEGKAPGRSDTLPILHVSEGAFWPGGNKLLGLVQVVPDAPDTYIFNESTANGVTGEFHDEFWRAWDRQQQPNWKPTADWSAIFFAWFEDPEYRWTFVNSSQVLDPEIEREIRETLTDDEKALLQMSYVRRGVGRVNVDFDQLAWRRYAIRNKCQGDVERFKQEYPATPQEAFRASGAAFFSADLIAEMRLKCEEPVFVGELLDPEAELRMART